MPAPCLSWTKHIVTAALTPPLPQQKGHCQDRQAEHLWQVSQFTDPSWRKPTKCLISTTVFCRQAHAHTQTSAWTVFSPEPAAMRATPCTLRLHSHPGSCALHLQLRWESLNRRILRHLRSVSVNENLIVFYTKDTRARRTRICPCGGEVFNIFRAHAQVT